MTTAYKKPTKKYLKALVLRKGQGSGEPGDRCAMQEVRAWLDLPTNTDEIPSCVCPVIGRLVISTQDYRKEWRAQIVPLLPRLIGSNRCPDVQIKRAFACADWAVRVCLPLAMDAIGLIDQAATLRALLPVTDKATADIAADTASHTAAHAAYAAYATRSATDATRAATRAATTADAAAYSACATATTAHTTAYATAYATAATADAAAVNPVALIERLLEITD